MAIVQIRHPVAVRSIDRQHAQDAEVHAQEDDLDGGHLTWPLPRVKSPRSLPCSAEFERPTLADRRTRSLGAPRHVCARKDKGLSLPGHNERGQ
ncbi:Hypothetical protein AA314_08204 [Archangium gephyra]|uniref:Uncharacterized protein n=1 Tax=Archangium gephyra TaxID=48 RepID=A0AAC8QFR3_9BACT|nr:Hypothetical protein AA314_08204 [Archangium gephyra]